MTKPLQPAIRFKGFTDAWEQRKIGEISDSFSGGTPSVGNSEYYNGNIPFIRSAEINSDMTEIFITEAGLLNSSAKLVKPGYILYALYGATSGEVGISKIEGAINQAILAIIPHKEFNSQFIMQWLYIKKESIINKYLQGGQGNLSGSIVKNIIIKIPSLREQEKIGNIFSIIDDTITLHQCKLDQLNGLKRTLLQKMFPKKDEKIPEYRLPGFTDAWEQRKLGAMGSTFTGLSGKTKDDFGHGEARFVTYMNVFMNPISDPTRTDAVEIDESQNTIQYGDVFFTTSSEKPEEVGMSSVWLENTKNTYLNSFCFGYRPTENIDPYYMAYMLRSKSIRKKIIYLAQGISRYNISKNGVMQIEVPLPGLSEQELLGKYFNELDKTITLHQRKLELLHDLKKTLLQRLFV